MSFCGELVKRFFVIRIVLSLYDKIFEILPGNLFFLYLCLSQQICLVRHQWSVFAGVISFALFFSCFCCIAQRVKPFEKNDKVDFGMYLHTEGELNLYRPGSIAGHHDQEGYRNLDREEAFMVLLKM